MSDDTANVPAKKTTAKKRTRAAAKKTTAKKAVAKKTTAKKTTRKRTTKKATAKKTTTKASTATAADAKAVPESDEVSTTSDADKSAETSIGRRAPTGIGAVAKRKRTIQTRLIIVGVLLATGVGASAAVGYSDKGYININDQIMSQRSPEEQANRTLPVQNTNAERRVDGGLRGRGTGGNNTAPQPASSASSTATTTASSTAEQSATSTDPTASSTTSSVDDTPSPGDQPATITASST